MELFKGDLQTLSESARLGPINSREKRLARILLLARYGKEGQPERIVPQISQETLAQMVGRTRPPISRFMN